MADSNQNPEIKIPGSVNVGAGGSSTQFYSKTYSENMRRQEDAAAAARNNANNNKSTISTKKTQIEYQDSKYSENQFENAKKAAEANQNKNGPSPSAISSNRFQESQTTDYLKTQFEMAQAAENYNSLRNTTYWLGNVSIVNSYIRKSNELLGNVVKNLKSLNKNITDYVNTDGGWNDHNSVTFAKWWKNGANDTLKKNGTEGLVFKDDANANSIKIVLNKCVKLYWMTICNQLYIVTKGKYPIKKGEFANESRKMYEYGGDLTYANAKITDSMWTVLLQEITNNRFIWHEDVKVSEEQKVNFAMNKFITFIELYGSCLKEFVDSLTAYVQHINNLLADKNVKYYFGLDPNPNLKSAAEDLIKCSESTVNSILETTRIFMEGYTRNVKKDIRDYFNTEYNINGGI